MDEYIFSLDIGSSKICGAAGKLERSGKVQIVGVTAVPCIGLKKGIVVDIDSTAASIKNCVEQLKKMIDKDITKVFISLPGGISELVPSKGVVAVSSEDREISRSDIKRVLNASRIISVPSSKEIIGVIPQQYIIDDYDNIKDPLGMSGMKLEVEALVILSQTTIVNNLLKSVQKAGLEVEGIVLEPIAVAQSVLKKDELSVDIAIVDVGLDKIDIAIYKNGNLIYTDLIPIGGNSITNDIAICLKIPYSEAEKLKIKYGSLSNINLKNNESIKVNVSYNDSITVDSSTLVAIIEARVEEILNLIHNRLMSSSHYEEIVGIVLVGGGIAQFNSIWDIGRSILNKPIRIGTPDFVGASNPIFNTSVGIIKDIYFNTNVKDLKKENNVDYETKNNSKLSKKKLNDENGNLLTKIKGFLADFF